MEKKGIPRVADRNVGNLVSRVFDTFPPTQEKGNNDLKTLGRLAGSLDLGTKVQCMFGSVESWSAGKNNHIKSLCQFAELCIWLSGMLKRV